MFDRRNSVIHRAGLVLDSQTSNPIATGDVGFWYDGTTLWKVDAAGNKTPSGGSGNTYHEAVRAATAAALATSDYDATALTLTKHSSAAALVIDGVTMANGDRVLVKNQTDQTQQGIYVVTNKGSGTVLWVLTRAPDASSSSQFEPGFIVPVSEGTVNADSVFEFTADAPFVMDTNNATFSLMPISITYGAAGDMASPGIQATTNVAGVSSKVARADHVHKFTQSATTGSTAGFAAGSATATKADSVWTGGTGTTGYTVGDVVGALKTLGILGL